MAHAGTRMKTTKTNEKLVLNRTNIRVLTGVALDAAVGGLCPPITYTCSCSRPGCKDV